MRQALPILIALSFFCATSEAASYYAIGSIGRVYDQVNSGAPIIADEYRFSVRGAGLGFGGTEIRLSHPNGDTIFSNAFAPGSHSFSNLEDLAAEFPSGSYGATLEYRPNPFSPTTIYSISGDAGVASVFPPAAQVINGTFEDGILIAGSDQLSFDLAPWVGRPAGSFISVSMGLTSKSYANSSVANVSFTNLQPNTTYFLNIFYFNPEAIVSTNFPSPGTTSTFAFETGGSSSTRITVRTVPEPSTVSMLATAALLFIANRNRLRA